MNRIITFVIVLPLLFASSNVFAKKPARSPRLTQQTEAITYANEHTSVLPSYRGYRRPSIERTLRTASEKTVAKSSRSSRSYRAPKPTFGVSPLSQSQATKAAPAIVGQVGRITSLNGPRRATETSVFAPSVIEPAQTQTDFAESKTPISVSPDFTLSLDLQSSLSNNGQEGFQQSPSRSLSRFEQVPTVDWVVLASPREQSEAIETAPLIPNSSRRVTSTNIAVPAPVISNSSRRISKIKITGSETDLQVSAPDTIVPTETEVDVVGRRSPTNTSPKFKYRSLTEYGRQNLQQSLWKPQPRPVQNPEQVVISGPVERTSLQPLETIEDSDLFEIAEQAFAVENTVVAVPLKSATLGSEEQSPFTSLSSETAPPSAAETENLIVKNGSPTEASASMGNAVAGRTTKAQHRANVRTAAKEARRQKRADGLWWFACALLVVPFLGLLCRLLWFGESHSYFEVGSAVKIPRQWNSSWENREDSDAELSREVDTETCSREFHVLGEYVDDLSPEAELLDEINSISSIASNSNSSANSISNSRAKTKS